MTVPEFIKKLDLMIKENNRHALQSESHKTVIRLAAQTTTLQQVIELAKQIKK